MYFHLKSHFVEDDRAVLFQMTGDMAKWKCGIKGVYCRYTITLERKKNVKFKEMI